MIYKKFSPSPELAAFVECYFIWDSENELVKDLMVESPPNGYCSIVFNCGDGYYLQNKKYALATMCIGVGQGYAAIIEKA